MPVNLHDADLRNAKLDGANACYTRRGAGFGCLLRPRRLLRRRLVVAAPDRDQPRAGAAGDASRPRCRRMASHALEPVGKPCTHR
ncbi:hypothetical protein ACWEWG_27400 [Streptomyces sp. NPDC003758]